MGIKEHKRRRLAVVCLIAVFSLFFSFTGSVKIKASTTDNIATITLNPSKTTVLSGERFEVDIVVSDLDPSAWWYADLQIRMDTYPTNYVTSMFHPYIWAATDGVNYGWIDYDTWLDWLDSTNGGFAYGNGTIKTSIIVNAYAAEFDFQVCFVKNAKSDTASGGLATGSWLQDEICSAPTHITVTEPSFTLTPSTTTAKVNETVEVEFVIDGLPTPPAGGYDANLLMALHGDPILVVPYGSAIYSYNKGVNVPAGWDIQIDDGSGSGYQSLEDWFNSSLIQNHGFNAIDMSVKIKITATSSSLLGTHQFWLGVYSADSYPVQTYDYDQMEAGYNPATALTTPFTGDLSNWLITAMATTFTITVANPTPPAVPTGVNHTANLYFICMALALTLLLINRHRVARKV